MPNHDDVQAMVPPVVPGASAVVYLTGVLEILGAVGLVVERTRKSAGLCLALLLVAMLPANIYAAIEGLKFAGEPAPPLWHRIPEQALYIGFALWPAVRPKQESRRAASTAQGTRPRRCHGPQQSVGPVCVLRPWERLSARGSVPVAGPVPSEPSPLSATSQKIIPPGRPT
jgi:uncharacterized membrane protein